jgi:hypothetical protein
MTSTDQLDELADRLDAISEELGDLAMALLRDAIAEGATSRPSEEKRLAQARRAIDKASHLLRGSSAAGEDE